MLKAPQFRSIRREGELMECQIKIFDIITSSGFLTALASALNSFSARAPPRTPLGELTAHPKPSSWFKGALLLRGGEEMEGKG